MDVKNYIAQRREQKGSNPIDAFFASLTDADVQKLEGTINQLQDKYLTALEHTAHVGIIESVASESPYAAVAMLESMTDLTEPTKKAAYMAIANRADRNSLESSQGSRVNAILRSYCLQQAGLPTEYFEQSNPKKAEI